MAPADRFLPARAPPPQGPAILAGGPSSSPCRDDMLLDTEHSSSTDPSSTPERQGPVVLLVDDVTDIRLGYRMLLELDGFRVIDAGDGATALAWLNSAHIDVAVVDMYLPGTIDGVDLVDRISRMPHRPVVIAMSGAPHVAYASALLAARNVGADATLTKPVSRDVLIRTIRSLLDRQSGTP